MTLTVICRSEVRAMNEKVSFLQNQVLDALLDNISDGLTAVEIKDLCGTTEARKIISDLRKKGFEITDMWESGENRFGRKTRFKRYKLEI